MNLIVSPISIELNEQVYIGRLTYSYFYHFGLVIQRLSNFQQSFELKLRIIPVRMELLARYNCSGSGFSHGLRLACVH